MVEHLITKALLPFYFCSTPKSQVYMALPTLIMKRQDHSKDYQNYIKQI